MPNKRKRHKGDVKEGLFGIYKTMWKKTGETGRTRRVPRLKPAGNTLFGFPPKGHIIRVCDGLTQCRNARAGGAPPPPHHQRR